MAQAVALRNLLFLSFWFSVFSKLSTIKSISKFIYINQPSDSHLPQQTLLQVVSSLARLILCLGWGTRQQGLAFQVGASRRALRMAQQAAGPSHPKVTLGGEPQVRDSRAAPQELGQLSYHHTGKKTKAENRRYLYPPGVRHK